MRLYRDKKLLLEDAIDKAIEYAKAMGYLKAYLDKKEFITMITKLLTLEEEIDLIGRDERAEGKMEIARNLLIESLEQ